MAYVLTSRTFDIISDSSNVNGVRFVGFQTTETWTNDSSPFDSYLLVQPTNVITTSPGHGSSDDVTFREVTNPYRSSGVSWPNPFTVRSVGLGDTNFQANAITSGPNNYTLTCTSTASYDMVEAQENVYREPYPAGFADIHYPVLWAEDAAPTPPPTLYAPNIASTSFIVQPVVTRTNQAPTISNFVPVTGSPILSTSVLQFDVTDYESNINRILLVVEFPNAAIREVIFDGDGFGPKYQNGSNISTPITGGWRFTVLRDGGWLLNDGPIITPFAIDLEGLENA